MSYSLDFSIVVPTWRGAIKFLPRLFDSIPDKKGIEIIVVDNSKDTVSRDEILSNREIILLHSDPDRHAGGSRNDGIKAAKGRWLLFADSDDFYAPDAFDVFYSMLNTEADIVYTGMGGIYEDTGERSDRGDYYANLVHDYVIGNVPERNLRLKFASPCCKMVSHELVDRHHIRFDEVLASNDVYFSLQIGFYANTIEAVDKVTYIATVSRGTLTRRRDLPVVESRYLVALRSNQFKREHGFHEFQCSVMTFLLQALNIGFKPFLHFVKLLFLYRQNPLVGYNRWLKTYRNKRESDEREKKYITK